ncbi:ABC transporter substrate binding protein (spermidine/putrescine) (plasmid) [Allorhizobium ampelinum S4]|uniref:ABC transporter substrate binding protein (Spermidine/putrescine) n=2 Tax=Rhizobium/Agrobacterium group TaxID=227290 RepID=B9K4P5_ALLAM|nr:ABC transporter substrate binding protein (spermidine/putrescine) [Allorhizobium ampelinum S4]
MEHQMSNQKRKGITRRGLIKGAAAVGGMAAGSGAISGFPTIWAQNIKDIKLVHVGQSYSTIKNIQEQASKDLGFTIEMQTADVATQMNRMLTQPESMDVADLANTSVRYLLGRNIVQPVTTKEYKWWDKTISLFQTGKYPNGKMASLEGFAPIKAQYYANKTASAYSMTPTEWLVGIPLYYNADTLGVRPDLIGSTKIDSWARLLDPAFKGHVALQEGVNVGLPDAAMALSALGEVSYVDKGNMTRSEIDKTIKKLIEYKKAGQFRSFWLNFDQSVQLMASGEVVLQSMWSPAVTEVRTRGIACTFQPLKEGHRGWYIMMFQMQHLTGLKRECAIEYMNWYNSGWAGAFISRQGFYNTVPENVKPLMSANEYGYWYEGKPASEPILNPFGKVMEKPGAVRDGGSLWDRMGNIGIWNTLMDEDRYLVRRWQDFIAA